VSVRSPAMAAARRRLEEAYGLALEGLEPEQVAAALDAASLAVGDPADPRFLARVVDHLPIDESWLFREDALWEFLRGALAARVDASVASGRAVRVLSLGCSAGQEPLSAAILLQGLAADAGIPASSPSHPLVMGVDPSPARIEAARSGIVPAWSVQRCRPEWLRGRVTTDASGAGRWIVDPAVRAMCRFEVGNLVDVAERGNAALGGYDLVLCRHVLIYFRPPEAARIAARLAAGLDPGAMLAFSAAEAHLVQAAGLEPLPYLGAGRAPRATARPTARCSARSRREPFAPSPSSGERARPVVVSASPSEGREDRTSRAAPVRDAAHLRSDPAHLYSRMLLGRQLIGVDAARGRDVLFDVLERASALPADAAVPCAEGISVGQLTAAVALLLGGREWA
jgi:chemotaxis methyl-accepting protein methylase